MSDLIRAGRRHTMINNQTTDDDQEEVGDDPRTPLLSANLGLPRYPSVSDKLGVTDE
jgi:hypothetical protein